MALRKLVYENQVTIIPAENLNAIQDAIIALEDGLFTMDAAKSGEVITMTDASNRGFRSLNIYGKTTQNGTPAKDAPVDLVSVGDSGSIMVSVTGENKVQKMIISTPNGLPGIPVTSGGNYKDANGQQWICDEIDLARGVYVKRVKELVFTGAEQWSEYAYLDQRRGFAIPNVLDATYVRREGMCNQFPVSNETDNCVWIGVGNATLYVVSSELVVNGVDAWKQHLSTSPMSVIYALTTPTETPLSDVDLAAYANLHTYMDSTTVSNDAGAYMNLEYVMDAKKYIDSKISSTILAATVE